MEKQLSVHQSSSVVVVVVVVVVVAVVVVVVVEFIYSRQVNRLVFYFKTAYKERKTKQTLKQTNRIN